MNVCAAKMNAARARSLISLVGWVERSETHHFEPRHLMMGFAALYPSYGFMP